MNHQDHHETDHFPLDDLAEDPQTIPDALAQEGWQTKKGEPETFILGSVRGAELMLMEHGAQWSRYRLKAGSLGIPRPSALLARNTLLQLPAKFISATDLNVDCVVDVPLEALTQPDSSTDRLAHNSRGLAAWARGLTGALIGKQAQPQHAGLEQIAQSLGQLGWAATAEEQSLEVHLQLANIYRQLRVEPTDIGYRVSAQLIPLAELSSWAAKSVRQLAFEANRRLPLVRFSEDVLSNPPWLLAEVHIRVALVPDVWLLQALSAVEAAVTTTSRELLALRDPELAQIFLAGN